MCKTSQENDMHEQAMNLIEEEYLAHRKEDTETAEKWTKTYFELEKKAAMR